MDSRPQREPLDGPGLRDLFRAAGQWLDANATAINAINVFPVPDGDTGSNMSLTFEATVSGAAAADDPAAAGSVAKAMARGALMGARGNSGVILSQIVRGFAEGLAGVTVAAPPDLARAFRCARDAGYASVPKPVEGTILTVIDAVAASAEHYTATGEPTCPGLITATVEAARDAVDRTPSLLPVLAEAGVVDAGGQGLLTILEGCRQHITGEGRPLPPPSAEAHAQLAAAIQHDEGEFFGYCTEVLVAGDNLSREEALERMTSLGRSVLVVGDETLLRVHVHTEDPGAAISFGTTRGTLLKVKVDNMEEQYRAWVASHESEAARPAPPAATTGQTVVAVTAGEGMSDVLRGLGVATIVPGGQTNNPSAQEILDGVAAAGGDVTFILPNNKNIVLAAQQVAKLAVHDVHVIPAKTFPQGVAAMIAFSTEATAGENLEAMTAACAAVHTVEVTRAVRNATVNGVSVQEGRHIAIVDGELTLAEDSAEETIMSALDRLVDDDTVVVTLYWGAGSSEHLARDLADRIAGAHSHVEIEVVAGAQPLYPYVVSVE